jgi:DNA-binding transcriptional LysR family regulator
MAHFTIRQLQVFVDAADTLSFARVAERLRLTPSAVSFQVRQIEQQVGFALFERIGRRVSLTEAGRTLVDYARPVLRSMHDAEQAVLALSGVTSGQVRLGLVSTAKYIVPHMIARFRTLHPGVKVLLQEGNRSQILTALIGGSIDLAIMGQPPPDAEVIAERFAPHPSVILASPNHRLAGKADLPPAALAGEFFVVREDGSGTRGLLDRFFHEFGIAPSVAMETTSNETIKQAVMAGMGVALLSQHTVALERSLGLVAVLDVQGFPVMRSWFVVQRRSLPLLPVQARLRGYVIEEGRRVIEEITGT